MDKVLNREESLQLMDLLGLERSAWGNIPLMRKAYLKKCKEFHPDKGGDEEKMKKMNTLYKKMEDGVKYANQPTQVDLSCIIFYFHASSSVSTASICS